MSAQGGDWKRYICRACGLIYDEALGDADSGIAAGTRFEDIPDDWVCPLCGVGKADFEVCAPRAVARPAAVARRREAGVVIVGAGAAGWAAAAALRELDAGLPITLVTGCSGDVYHKPELSLALSRGQSAQTLVRETAAAAAGRLGVQLLSETFAVGLSPALHQLRTTRGSLRYRQLVLAQGARPALPAPLTPGLCWRVNDLAAWSGLRAQLAQGPQRVAIVGAGMVGCELAEDLARCGHEVSVLDCAERPLAALLPPPAAARLQQAWAGLGIRFIGGAQIRELLTDAAAPRVLQLADGRRVAADLLLAATGLQTEARLARSGGLAFERGIVVDPQTLRSSAEDVYALGDCISLDGRPCRFIEPIALQAEALAHAVLGRAHAGYRHRPPVIRLKTRALPVTLEGAPCADGEWRTVEDGPLRLVMQQWRDGERIARLTLGPAPLASAA